MNLLMNDAPTKVKVGKERFLINTDYRTGIRFELLILNQNMSNDEKLVKALGMYYGKQVIPLNLLESAVSSMLWFYACGNEEELKKGKKRGSSPIQRVYDYDYDSDYIYAAFLQQYKFDLQKERLHWWKFRAMFKALTEETEFIKIVGYRSTVIDNNMTRSQKQFYQKMKRLHALPLPKDEQQKLSAIEEALLNGGDLSDVLA